MQICAENTKNSGFSGFWETKLAQKCETSWVKNWSTPESKIGLHMLRNIIGPIFDSGKSILTCFAFVQQSCCFCRENAIFEKQKKDKRKRGPIFDPEKAIFGPILTLQHIYNIHEKGFPWNWNLSFHLCAVVVLKLHSIYIYIHIYIYACCEVTSWATFGHFNSY